MSQVRAVRQIDLVPTLSLLLGLPIPFSNLGMVIEELFDSKDHRSLVEALHVNAQQVNRYVQHYVQQSGEFDESSLKHLDSIYNSANTKFETMLKNDVTADDFVMSIKREYVEYLQQVRHMCEAHWAKFDVGAMFIAVCVLTVTIAMSFLTVQVSRVTYEQKIIWQPSVFALVSTVVGSFLALTDISSTLPCLLFASLTLVGAVYMWRKTWRSNQNKVMRLPFRVLPAVQVGLMALPLVGSLSNSYIVYSDDVHEMLVKSSIIVHLLMINARMRNEQDTKLNLTSGKLETVIATKSKKRLTSHDIGYVISSPRFLSLLLVVMLCVVLRLSSHMRLCREEQLDCRPTLMLKSLASFIQSEKTVKQFRYFYSVAVISLSAFILRTTLTKLGNLNGLSVAATVGNYVLPFCVVNVIVYWTVALLPNPPTWTLTTFPLIVYISVMLSVVLLYASPLAVHVVSRSAKHVPVVNTSDVSAVPVMFNHLKNSFKNNDNEKDKPPLVFGLASVFSAPVLILASGKFTIIIISGKVTY